jgi:DNA polymerase-3 subunit alpha
MEGLQANARLKAVVRTSDIKALASLAQLLDAAGSGRGEVILDAPLDGGQTATVRLGRNFALDAELAARIEAMEGIEAVTLSAADSPRLALVS